jgi:hypothetical protein
LHPSYIGTPAREAKNNIRYLSLFSSIVNNHRSRRPFSLLRASLVVVVIIASIVYSSDAASQYVNSASVFGRCANFSIQARTSVSFNGVQTNIFSGSVGNSPGTSITGTPVLGTGYTLEANTSPAINCATDQNIAYLFFKGVPCSHTLASTELSGLTLLPGVYCTATGITLTNTPLYLDAQWDANAQFIFQMATTLITSTNTQIILLNGALVKNIYWQVGSAATLGTSSSFMGQILASTSISVGVSTVVVGRLFAQAAVSFAGTDQVTLPSQY